MIAALLTFGTLLAIEPAAEIPAGDSTSVVDPAEAPASPLPDPTPDAEPTEVPASEAPDPAPAADPSAAPAEWTESPTPFAAASEPASVSDPDPAPRYRAGIDLGMLLRGPEAERALSYSPVLRFAGYVTPDVELGLEWGFAGLRLTAPGSAAVNHIGLGNPVLSVRYYLEGSGLSGDLALGLVLPVAGLGDDARLRRTTYAYAAATRALHDPWLWAANRTGALVSMQATPQRSLPVRLRGEATAALLFRRGELADDAADDETDLFVRLTADAALPVRQHGHIGARLQAMAMPDAGFDRLQLALAPYISVVYGDIEGHVQAWFPIDEPINTVTTWGLQVGANVRF